jgi:branched-chain amino acid transport system ATP-binding protein
VSLNSDGIASSLEAVDLSAGYGGVPVVHDLNVRISAGELVALLGPNGAGKTTTMLTLAGYLAPIVGEVNMDGKKAALSVHKRARKGVAFITEDRAVFQTLTAAENLRLGAGTLEDAIEHVPELRPLLNRRAGLLSGGEQQLLALARALAGRPRFLLIDELSLGLAPLVVTRLLGAVRLAADSGVGVLFVEQYANRALTVADRAYVLQRGRVVASGTSQEIKERIGEVEGMYLSTHRE